MFEALSVKELKTLVRDLRAHHNIRGYSRMKKETLVGELTTRFVLRDGNLYLKEERAASVPKPARSPKKELERNIYQYLSGLTHDVLNTTSPRGLRDEFQALSGIDMAPHKAMFRKLAEEVLIDRRR